MGMMTALAVGMAGTQIAGGIAKYKEGQYNSAVLARQAGMVEEKKKIQAWQDSRITRKVMGQTVSATAGKGIKPTGSPMAIMVDTQTQLEMDAEIAQYNLDIQKFGIEAKGKAEERRGRYGLYKGIAGGLTSLYSGYASLSTDTKVAKAGSGA